MQKDFRALCWQRMRSGMGWKVQHIATDSVNICVRATFCHVNAVGQVIASLKLI